MISLTRISLQRPPIPIFKEDLLTNKDATPLSARLFIFCEATLLFLQINRLTAPPIRHLASSGVIGIDLDLRHRLES